MMSRPSRVTLREIAEATGVTRMAVSLALRGKSGVSEATRAKVLKVAEKLGYQPDPEVAKLLSRIRSQATTEITSALALLTTGPTPIAWKRSLTERKYVQGAIERAKRYGYRVEEFWLNEPGMSANRLGNIIWNRGIEGVILTPLQQDLVEHPGRSIDFPFHLFAVVEISETVHKPDLDRAVHDQYRSMQLLLTELRNLNYQRIGLVLDRALDVRVNGKWTAAYLEDQTHRKDKTRLPPLLVEQRQQSVFNRWFDRYKPDVVISIDHCGLRFLETLGLRIPEEVGLATLDWDGEMDQMPEVSGIDQNSWYVGAAAVDMLVASIQREDRGIPAHPMHTQIQGSWRPGKTTRQLSAPG